MLLMPFFSVWADIQKIISPNSLDFIYQQTHQLDIIWPKKTPVISRSCLEPKCTTRFCEVILVLNHVCMFAKATKDTKRSQWNGLYDKWRGIITSIQIESCSFCRQCQWFIVILSFSECSRVSGRRWKIAIQKSLQLWNLQNFWKQKKSTFFRVSNRRCFRKHKIRTVVIKYLFFQGCKWTIPHVETKVNIWRYCWWKKWLLSIAMLLYQRVCGHINSSRGVFIVGTYWGPKPSTTKLHDKERKQVEALVAKIAEEDAKEAKARSDKQVEYLGSC